MKITTATIWENRSGCNTSWFHPRCCRGPQWSVFMSLQSLMGSDFYGSVHESLSWDEGRTWSTPALIPDLEWKNRDDDIVEGVCDVVPEYHEPTGTVLAIGHNVYYKGDGFYDSLGDWSEQNGPVVQRFPVWSIRDLKGNWIRRRKKLVIPELEDCPMYSCGSSQRLFQGKDEVLIPICYQLPGRREREVFSIRCHYDGLNLTYLERGNILRLPHDRGIMEPSVIRWKGQYLLTLRVEDGYAYQAKSADCLQWEEMIPWTFSDGIRMKTDSTQQHFLLLGERLFLVYVRDNGENSSLPRFRAPLFIAEVNEQLLLIRASERILFPIRWENGKAAGMGNFQTTTLSDTFGIVTVSEERFVSAASATQGDTLIAFIDIAKN